jgi:hypothetical protein
MEITRRCPFSGLVTTLHLPITEEQYTAWQNGMLSQNAFPKLNTDEREFIQTGILPDVWDEKLGKWE